LSRPRTRRWATPLVLAAALPLAACKFQMTRMDLNRPLSRAQYDVIELGADRRTQLLAKLGPPDAVLYTRSEEVFDYLSRSHRATNLRFFFPSDATPLFVDPFAWLGVHRYFFDPFEEPAAFRPTFTDQLSRYALDTAVSYVPFTRGEDIVILRSRQLRGDILRVVLDRDTHQTLRKAVLLSTGEYARESWADRAFLGAD
jgi:hypothetical protein